MRRPFWRNYGDMGKGVVTKRSRASGRAWWRGDGLRRVLLLLESLVGVDAADGGRRASTEATIWGANQNRSMSKRCAR